MANLSDAEDELLNELMTQVVMPNSSFMCDLSENMDLQAVRMKAAQEWSDQIYWAIRGQHERR